jgi:hypothetical protein
MTDDQPKISKGPAEVLWALLLSGDPEQIREAMDGDRVRAPLPGLGQEVSHRDWPGRPLRQLSESGLLWLINATCFHPRGYALALSMDTRTGEVTGWDILGDGTEPWSYAGPVDDRFRAAEATLVSHRAPAESDGVLRTPEDWQRQLPDVEILDPDGWRGPNGRPWDEPITEAEYLRRRALCTVTSPKWR